MDQNNVNRILQELESGYDQMAEKFSQTRKFFWRDFEFIADFVEDGDKVLDYGCGNGRLLEILKDKKIEYTGADVSQKLIEIAKNKHPEHKFIKLDSQGILPHTKSSNKTCTNKEYSSAGHSQDLVWGLPFNDNYFNKVISIAVFHHFPQEYAKKMAKELFRITKAQGKIIVTAWNLNQERFKEFAKKDSFDLYIPFKNNEGKIFERYHRLYTKEDLEKIFFEAGFRKQRSEIINEKNILYIGEK